MSVAEVPNSAKPIEADSAKGKAVVLYDGMCPICCAAGVYPQAGLLEESLHCQDCRDTLFTCCPLRC